MLVLIVAQHGEVDSSVVDPGLVSEMEYFVSLLLVLLLLVMMAVVVDHYDLIGHEASCRWGYRQTFDPHHHHEV